MQHIIKDCLAFIGKKMTHNKSKQSIEIDSQQTRVLELIDKGIKILTIIAFSVFKKLSRDLEDKQKINF